MKHVGYLVTTPDGHAELSQFGITHADEAFGFRSSPVYLLTDDEITAITPFDLDCFAPRQREMVKYIRAGLSNKLIAHEMKLSEATVKVYIRDMFRRVKVNSRNELLIKIGMF